MCPNYPSGAFDVMLADVAITHSDGTVTLFPLSGRGEIVTHVSKARHGAPKVVVALPDVGHPPDRKPISRCLHQKMASGGDPVHDPAVRSVRIFRT